MTVTGGAGGFTARFEDLRTLAALSDELAGGLAAAAVKGHGVLASPDLLASIALDPTGFATVEKALLSALDGQEGLTLSAAGFASQAVALRATAALYETTEQAQQAAFDAVAWSLGANPLLAPMLGLVTLPQWLPWAAADFALHGGDPQSWLSDHLGLVDTVLASSPGLITWLSGGTVTPADVTAGGHLLGLMYPEGTADVRKVDNPVAPGTGKPEGEDPDNPLTEPPHTLGDLYTGLNYRNEKVSEQSPDTIDVRVITQADGSKAYIVDIPGTKVWDAPGEDPGTHLNTLGTNVHLTGGETTARELAIAEALYQAGATSADPVMLVGHSQGGIIAAQAAHDSGNGAFGYGGQSFNVTHVVTAGAPIGRIDIPPQVQVLALENEHDIVPHLDGAQNPDRANVTTVTFDEQLGSFGENHDMRGSYAAAGRYLDSSDDVSVRRFTDSAGVFLPAEGAAVSSDYDVYTIERRSP